MSLSFSLPRTAVTLAASVGAALFVSSSSNAAPILFLDRAPWEASVVTFADVDLASQVADFALLTAGSPLTLPAGDFLSFDIDTQGRQVPGSWATWSGGNTPRVLYTLGVNSLTGTFSTPQSGFGFEVEPNVFSTFNVSVLLSDGSFFGSPVDGKAGATFFGFDVAGGPGITSFEITCEPSANTSFCGGFAIGRMVQAVPEPNAALLLGLGLAGLGAVGRKPRALASGR